MGVKLMPYDPKVTVLRQTENPAALCMMAAATTQQSSITKLQINMTPMSILQKIAEMGHTSIFEHASVTFLLENVSRGCVDQITRHRIGSFTCSSTHYEAHEDTVYLVPSGIERDASAHAACEWLHNLYTSARKESSIGAEARQLLPLAISCRLMWAVNARSLINFLRVRLCERNTIETVMVARRIRGLVREWFPELFMSDIPLPECARTKCDQGHMSCCGQGSHVE